MLVPAGDLASNLTEVLIVQSFLPVRNSSLGSVISLIMERHLDSAHVEHKREGAANVVHGEQITDDDLLKAGVDEVLEDDVANVDLVGTYLAPPHQFTTDIPSRQLRWVLTSQKHSERVIANCTSCASWSICARR